ncbi:MAG: alpha-1,2-fucosyltransferase [Methanobacteriaceae archaeon]
MITVNITGGLGNQLFQYATARSLSKNMKTKLYLDLSHYNSSSLPNHVKYYLNHFNIKTSGIKGDLKWRINSKISGEEERFEDYSDVYENYSYKKNIEDLKGNIYLDGYWANESYFIENEEVIRDDLKIVTPPSKENKSFMKELEGENGVALSVRRGDYLEPYFKAQFGFCTLSYYEKAINKISSKIDNPKFYVFSDDPEWVMDKIKIKYPTKYISHNYKKGKYYEDLRLMSLCKHFIMANSTFSWWGAWLSQNKNKIVVGPEPWLNNYIPNEMMPKKWLKVKCNRSEIFNKSLELVYKCENIKLTDEFELNPINLNKKYDYDSIIKISISSTCSGTLKIYNNLTSHIIIGYDSGNCERYIYLDKKIPLDTLKLSNDNKNIINMKLEIKKVKEEW